MFCLDRRWDVVYARDDHNDRTHLVEIAVTSRTAEVIRVPKLLDRLPGYLAFAAVLRTRPGGRIEISVADTESGLVLSVRDNGKPMDADRIEERVRAAVETGDPTGEDASFAGVVLAVSSLFASRSGGSCSINVASSGETEALVVTPSGAAI
jgi:light-regulated signal transduction histidine kinase (bacteriophytochrome)